jgi:hypothetical protein
MFILIVKQTSTNLIFCLIVKIFWNFLIFINRSSIKLSFLLKISNFFYIFFNYIYNYISEYIVIKQNFGYFGINNKNKKVFK